MKYIDIQIPVNELSEFLKEKGWLQHEQVLTLSRPGDGNMNVVLRVTTDRRTFILKQARPFVQKYQDIPAPLERIETEYQFYKTANLKNKAPSVLQYAPEDHLLMMEDLGETKDLTSIYNDHKLSDIQIKELILIAQTIHNSSIPSNFPKNLALRKLNHQHIFVLPFLNDNGFDLNTVQEGLHELSLPIKNNKQLKQIVETIGRRYLSPGEYLIHGDFYPGSWMMVNHQLFVLDPEFSFVGFREFDLGVMAGHLILSTMSTDALQVIFSNYDQSIDEVLTKQIAGIEIIRRIVGLAQLPLVRSLPEKEHLLKLASDLILI